MSLGDFLPLISEHFYSFLKDCYHTCVSSILGHVFAPDASLDKIVQESTPAKFLEHVVKA